MKVDTTDFMFFPQFVLALVKAMEQGKTVIEFKRGRSAPGHDHIDIEFEVRITKFDGKPLPRITQRMLQKAKKETKQ